MKLKKIKKISDIKTDWGCQYLIKLHGIWLAGRFLIRTSSLNGNDTLHFRPLPMDIMLGEIGFDPPLWKFTKSRKKMKLEELEEQVKDLKAKMEAKKNVAQERMSKLSLYDAIFELCMHWGQGKGWLKTRHAFVLGNIVCCIREPKDYYSWERRVTVDGVLVYECARGEHYAQLFKDGKWADSVSNAWREKKAMMYIERLTKQIANLSPMEEK